MSFLSQTWGKTLFKQRGSALLGVIALHCLVLLCLAWYCFALFDASLHCSMLSDESGMLLFCPKFGIKSMRKA